MRSILGSIGFQPEGYRFFGDRIIDRVWDAIDVDMLLSIGCLIRSMR